MDVWQFLAWIAGIMVMVGLTFNPLGLTIAGVYWILNGWDKLLAAWFKMAAVVGSIASFAMLLFLIVVLLFAVKTFITRKR